MSSPNIDGNVTTEMADGAVTARRFGTLTAAGIAQITATGARADRIIMFDAATGVAVSCYEGGIHEVTSGGAINRGDEVMSDNAGKAVVFASGSGRYRAGVAESTVTGANLTVNVFHRRDVTPVA